MALVGKMNVAGRDVDNVYVRIKRILGGKDEGYNSVVEIFWDEASKNGKHIGDFNHPCAYNSDESQYVTVYKSLKQKFNLQDA